MASVDVVEEDEIAVEGGNAAQGMLGSKKGKRL